MGVIASVLICILTWIVVLVVVVGINLLWCVVADWWDGRRCRRHQ